MEKRAIEEVVISSRCKEVYLIESPLAGAIGAGVDINEGMYSRWAPERQKLLLYHWAA